MFATPLRAQPLEQLLLELQRLLLSWGAMLGLGLVRVLVTWLFGYLGFDAMHWKEVVDEEEGIVGCG